MKESNQTEQEESFFEELVKSLDQYEAYLNGDESRVEIRTYPLNKEKES